MPRPAALVVAVAVATTTVATIATATPPFIESLKLPGFYGTELGCQVFAAGRDVFDVRVPHPGPPALTSVALVRPGWITAAGLDCQARDGAHSFTAATMECRISQGTRSVPVEFSVTRDTVIVDMGDWGTHEYRKCPVYPDWMRDADLRSPLYSTSGTTAACHRFAIAGYKAIYTGIPLPGEAPEDPSETILIVGEK